MKRAIICLILTIISLSAYADNLYVPFTDNKNNDAHPGSEINNSGTITHNPANHAPSKTPPSCNNANCPKPIINSDTLVPKAHSGS